MVDSPEEVYKSLAKVVTEKLQPVFMEEALWVEDENMLRQEMAATATQTATTKAVHETPLNDWTSLLSDKEQKKYQAYLADLGMSDTVVQDRPLRAVAVSQSPDFIPMTSTVDGVCCGFTLSTPRVMLTNKNRWICALEKCAMAGLPVLEDQGFKAHPGCAAACLGNLGRNKNSIRLNKQGFPRLA